MNNKLINNLENLGILIVTFLGSLFAIALSYYSAFFTEYNEIDEDIPLTARDHALWRILIFVLVFLLLLLINRAFQKHLTEKREKIICYGSICLATLLGFVWICIAHIKPIADSGCVCTVAGLFLKGEYAMQLPTYMGYCPHQYGMVFILQMMFTLFGSGNYFIWEIMNCLLLPFMLLAGYRTLKFMRVPQTACVLYSLMAIGFLPIYFYLPYVYGDFPAAACGMIALANVLELLNTNQKKTKIKCIICFLVAILLGCTVRKNLFVILIAAGILLVFYAIKQFSWKPVALLLAAIIVVFGSEKGIETYYETISGQSISPGIPMSCYIMMGLQDTEKGPGWFNGSNYRAMSRFDYDYDQANDFAKQEIKDRMKYFADNKSYTIDFFRRKIVSQWNMPDYFSLHETYHFNVDEEELVPIVPAIYNGSLTNGIQSYMNNYQFVLYVGFAFAMLCSLRKIIVQMFLRKEENSELKNQILLVGILGGLFFSILWEAMSRYVFGYVFLMIPLSATGLDYVINLLLQHQKKTS